MKKAVHFGAGNIGRGFIGEILHKNDYFITFVDINQEIIQALKDKSEYVVERADEFHEQIKIDQVTGLNSVEEAEQVVAAIAEADMVTTAIGPNVLPKIASLIARGIDYRKEQGNTEKIDVIACENMIGGSTYLKEQVLSFIQDVEYLESYIGFPDAAVDRIVPLQHHEDPLFVQVEPFSEWVVDKTTCKSTERLTDVHYVSDLEPYIERKLFSVNTGHATVAYTGALQGYNTIDEAMEDPLVLVQLRSVLKETGKLLIAKWGFDPVEHEQYMEKIIGRFQNKYISDAISRVARTPMRKLGNQERFVRPILELSKYNVVPYHLFETIGMIFNYYDPEDEQSCQLKELMGTADLEKSIIEVTGIENDQMIDMIKENIEKYAYVAA
ncbi:mannitol-1-phosphate 5-dehydrogenase [Enterococcus sp. LJL99]